MCISSCTACSYEALSTPARELAPWRGQLRTADQAARGPGCCSLWRRLCQAPVSEVDTPGAARDRARASGHGSRASQGAPPATDHAGDCARRQTTGAAALGEHGAPSRSEIAIHLARRRMAKTHLATSAVSRHPRIGAWHKRLQRRSAAQCSLCPPYLRSSISHLLPASPGRSDRAAATGNPGPTQPSGTR